MNDLEPIEEAPKIGSLFVIDPQLGLENRRDAAFVRGIFLRSKEKEDLQLALREWNSMTVCKSSSNSKIVKCICTKEIVRNYKLVKNYKTDQYFQISQQCFSRYFRKCRRREQLLLKHEMQKCNINPSTSPPAASSNNNNSFSLIPQ